MAARTYGLYYMGLDIGTESVGWAVTDPQYHVLKFGKRAMWGARLFPEAQTAAERRVYRIARRRIDRRAQRLALVQSLFEDAIGQVDPGFFMRLQEGAVHAEDKTHPQKNTLFNDAGLTDKDYHRQYPTIYHLRHELMTSAAVHDVRLVYLAVHHIIKYRGHFLFGGNLDEVPSLPSILQDFTDEGNDEYGFALNTVHQEEVSAILTNQSLSMSAKQRRLNDVLDAKDKRSKAFVKALTGGRVNLADMFDLPVLEGREKVVIEFGTEEHDAKVPELEELLGEDYYFLDKLKAIHDWAILERLLAGASSLSAAKVGAYEAHRADLKLLKRVVRRHLPEMYKTVFSDPNTANNYACYVGKALKNGKKIAVAKRCSQADFHRFVSSLLKAMPQDDAQVKELTQKLEAATLMPKATSKGNSVIPNQLHFRELRAILTQASAYLPFLEERDAQGLSITDKLLQILTFRIPYYVGPLNDRDPKRQNTWVVRRSREKVYPWNFDQVVDVQASASDFITRMTSQCSYMQGEKVLPKRAILYSRFMVLNELNNLKLDSEPISPDLKQDIYRDLFLRRSRVTAKGLMGYLSSRGYSLSQDSISGIDGDFKSSMKSLNDMRVLLGESFQEGIAEEIIRLSTIFGDDREMLHQRLTSAFQGILPVGVIKRASAKRYTGWGRLSERLLTGLQAPHPETGEFRSIMQMLWDTNNNLMQLLSREFFFQDALKEYNQRHKQEQGFDYQLVDELYISPSVKRAVWQAMKIVREIRKVTGRDPDKVFIEMARGAQKKVRTESRKKTLSELYKKCGEDAADLAAVLESREDHEFRRDRLYLYFTQLGRCLYTGNPININRIFDETLYDIDHIYPQSKVKDDSLDNRVLVERNSNANKGDVYPIAESVRQSRRSFWNLLLDKGLISKRKHERLIRSTALEPQELLDFIARQLVETRQSTKAVAQLLEQLLPNTRLVYVKAGLVSDFRQQFDLLKCREVNDLHHAADAYLSIVAGNAYNTKFTDDPRNFFRQADHSYNLRTFFERDIRRGDSIAWVAGEGGTIRTVKQMARRNNALITRMSFEQRGQLFDTQLVRKGEWQVPQSMSRPCFADQTKYGGYNKAKGSYFMLVEHDAARNKRVRSLIDMPLRLADSVDPMLVHNMLVQDKQLKNPQIIIPKIRMHALLEVEGFRMNVTGRTGDSLVYAPAVQLVIGPLWEGYLRDVLKFSQRAAEYRRVNKTALQVREFDGITAEQNLALYDVFVMKLSETIYRARLEAQAKNLAEARERFAALSTDAQCDVLSEILNMFKCNRSTADLKAIGLGGQLGIVRTNKTMSGFQSAKLIHQSITGLFEQVVDVLA